MGPLTAPSGTAVVTVVGPQAVTGAGTEPEAPRNTTEGVAAVSKAPERVTTSPTRPEVGSKDVMPMLVAEPPPEPPEPPPALAGLKVAALVAVPLPVWTRMVPLVTPAGTMTMREVGVASRTVAAAPLKVTALPVGTREKPVPRMRTRAPSAALAGVKVVMAGAIEGTAARGSASTPRVATRSLASWVISALEWPV
ncbi:hypothetical protein D3C87_1368660 [compost metagenome]